MKNLLKNCEAVVITSASNLFYFSKYINSDAVIIFWENKKYYFTDSRYAEEVNAQLEDFNVKDINELDTFIRESRFGVLGCEDSISYNTYQHYISLGVQKIIFVTDEIKAMRAVKMPYELDAIKKAQAITDKTFSQILDYITEGITERELASRLESLLMLNGAEELAFKSIVAFGENTSKPHAHRSDKKLLSGMFVTMDFGAKYSGYCSDMTRTVMFGRPTLEQKELYENVYNAQLQALDNIKAGLSGIECDAIARNYFASKNLDKYFVHSLGHSLGIDIHENPNFSPKCDAIIGEGTVLSVEPGLYIPQKYGVRIEDLVYFDKKGINNLTKSEKKMIIL